ncbi:MAG TPA: hypothetical protein PK990_06765 [Salinivirgaceae bacterium]|nr:hypothetical protein [Salinivirgaceae bacterium]
MMQKNSFEETFLVKTSSRQKTWIAPRLKMILLVPFFILAIYGAKAQTDVSAFLNLTKDGIKDIETLTEAYLTPMGKGFATSLSGGWFNTAKTHHPLGFDFTLGFTLVTFPDEDKRFKLNNYNWNVLTWDRNQYTNPVSPTIAGKQSVLLPVGIETNINNQQVEINNLFTMPQGVNLPAVGLPLVQLGLGIGFGTDIQARLLPPLTISDYGSIDIWGIGIKHDFKRWIPVVNKLPFDASIAVNYSSVNSVFEKMKYFPTDFLSVNTQYVDPQLMRYMSTTPSYEQNIEADFYSKQNLKFHMNSFAANLIVSSKLLFLTLYGSVGYSASNFGILFEGPYLLPTIELDGTNVVYALRESGKINNPIDIKIKHNSIRTGLGARINMAFITLHGDVTYQDYMMYNFGLGISIR